MIFKPHIATQLSNRKTSSTCPIVLFFSRLCITKLKQLKEEEKQSSRAIKSNIFYTRKSKRVTPESRMVLQTSLYDLSGPRSKIPAEKSDGRI